MACTGSAQVASIDLKNDKLLALLDVGKTPVNLALKPDGGELMVSNFDSDNISIIETSTNEVGGSYLIGTHPARGLVTADNSRLYVSNFGSNSVAVYDIDQGKVIASLPVGSEPDALALSESENYSAGARCPGRRYHRHSEARAQEETRTRGIFLAHHDSRRRAAQQYRGEVVCAGEIRALVPR